MPDGARAAVPAAWPAGQLEDLVEVAGIAIDDQRVSVAASLNGHVVGNRIGSGIALVHVVKADGDLRLRAGNGGIRNAGVWIRSEIRVQSGGRADRVDVIV